MQDRTAPGVQPHHYDERSASLELQHLVACYWAFTVATGLAAPFLHHVFADGCAQLAYHRSPRADGSRLRVAGPRLKSLQVPVGAGDLFWGVRLAPAACSLVLRCDPGQLVNCNLAATAQLPPGGEQLRVELDRACSFEHAIDVYTAYLSGRGIGPRDVDGAVASAVWSIDADPAASRVAEIAAVVGLSVRQLERRLRAATGLTPKQFARARRLRATAVRLVEQPAESWGNRAAAMGFADQAHLCREVAELAGHTPVDFAATVADIEHGKLVK